MYTFFRVIILFVFIILFIIIFYKKIKTWIQLKRNILWILLGFTIFFYIISFIPFEIPLLSFQTPEDAFKYTHSSSQILNTIESKNCAFIIFNNKNNGFSCTYVRSEKGKWKARNPNQKLDMSLKSEGTLTILKVENKEDNVQLIAVYRADSSGDIENLKIYDNLNSEFIYCDFLISEKYNYKIGFRSTIIPYPASDYHLYVEEKEILIE